MKKGKLVFLSPLILGFSFLFSCSSPNLIESNTFLTMNDVKNYLSYDTNSYNGYFVAHTDNDERLQKFLMANLDLKIIGNGLLYELAFIQLESAFDGTSVNEGIVELYITYQIYKKYFILEFAAMYGEDYWAIDVQVNKGNEYKFSFTLFENKKIGDTIAPFSKSGECTLKNENWGYATTKTNNNQDIKYITLFDSSDPTIGLGFYVSIYDWTTCYFYK